MIPLSRALRTTCLAALLSCGLAGNSQVQQARPAPPTYRISGKVVDAHTGAALASCSVQIANVKNSHQAFTVKSGDAGEFAFDGLQLGKYSLAASRHGYLPQNYEEHGFYSTAIAVGPGLTSENLTFKLVGESVLTGTVTDGAGEPVRGAQLQLFEDQNSDGNLATRST